MYSESNQILVDLRDFEKYKKMTVNTAKLLKNDDFMRERGEIIEHCGDLIQFDGEKLVSANFCRQRLCPNCQRRKSLKTYANFKKIADELTGNGFVFLHIVLTVQNCEASDLGKTISQLYSASSKLFKMQDCKRVFKGVLRCLEVTFSARNFDFHPHLHCLVAVKKSYFTSRYYLKTEKLRELWQRALNVQYLPQVWASRCDDSAIAEVAKYAVKPLEIDLTDTVKTVVLKELFFALHGRRLLQTYGIIRTTAKSLKIDLDRDDDGADEEACEVDFAKIVSFVYNFSTEKYEPIFSNKKN